jgi:hypothetical protein
VRDQRGEGSPIDRGGKAALWQAMALLLRRIVAFTSEWFSRCRRARASLARPVAASRRAPTAARHIAVATIATLVLAACSGTEEAATTVTEPVATAAGSETGAQDPGAGGRRLELHFSGNGDTSLPPFRVKQGGSLLHWTNRGEVFSLFGTKGTIVDSTGARGETFLAGGVHRIDVIASGDWTVAVPGARRVKPGRS